MKRRYILIICLVAAFGLSAPQVQATILSYDLLSFTGDPMEMDLTISDELGAGTGGIKGYFQFNLLVDTSTTGNTGDLRGFFLNLDGFTGSLAEDDFYEPDTGHPYYISDTIISNDSVNSTGGGNTIRPAGDFDVGIEFGTPGIGTDDIQEARFYLYNYGGSLTLDHLVDETDDMGLLFAARFTSVGPDGSDRTGSSKISLLGVRRDNAPPNPVPEPATLILFGSGMIGLGAVMRRQRPATRAGRNASRSRLAGLES